MSTTATDERVGRLPSRVAWLSGVHFLIALALLAAAPLALNEVLLDTFFSPSYVWVRHGEMKGWASSALDEFFLATPYWTSYEPGWIIGLLPSLLVASAAWGLRKQRAWGRQLAIGLHAAIAVVALAAIAWAVYGYGAMEWAFLRADRSVGGPDSLAGLEGVLYAILGAAALGLLVVAGSLLWWLRRPVTRSCFPSAGRRDMRTLLACCIGLTAGVLVPELAYNRIAVYRGEATYQGKSTGDWLTLLASPNAATRQAALEKLGESAEAAPVLCEMVCDKPSRPDTVRPIFREEVRRISREAGRPLYWSRVWQTPDWNALTELWKRTQKLPGAVEGVLPKPLTVKLNDRVSCLAFASDGRMLAIGVSDTVELVDPANGQAIRTIRDPGMLQPYRTEKKMCRVKSMSFSPDGKTLAVASDLGVKLWDVAEAREVATLFGHGKPGMVPHECDAHSVVFSPDGKTMATSRNWAIELWHLEEQLVREVTHNCGGLAFSPGGKILATAEYHSRVHLWDVASGRQLAEDHPQMGILHGAAFSPDGKVLAALSEGSVALWDVRVTSAAHELVQRPVRLRHGSWVPIHCFAFSPDSKTLATGGGDLAKLWEVATGRELATVDRSARCVALSPDGRTLAVGGAVSPPGPVSEVRLWEVAAALKPEVLAARARKAAMDLVEGLQTSSANSQRGRDEKSLGNALFALGPHCEAAVPLLIESLNDPRVDVRRQICIALGQIGSQNEYVMSALIEAIEDESSEVRRAAGGLLRQIARDDVETRRRVEEAVTHARRRMESAAAEPSAVVRRGGETLCDGRTVPEWIALLGQHYVPNEIFGRSGRGRPAEAIRAIGPTEAVPAMIEALTEEDWRMRVGAADGLGMFGADAKSAIPPLVQALEDKSQQVRHLAAHSLGEISSSVGAEPTAALLKLLEHEDASVQLAAARAVLGIDADHEPAMGLLKDALAGLLRPAAAARFGLEGPEEEFETVPEEPEPEAEPQQPIRKAAVVAYGPRHELAMEAMILGSLGARAAPAVPELIEILCSDDVRNTNADDYSRRAAAETLGQIGPAAKGAIPAMIQALKDPEHGVCAAASRNLAKLTPEAVPAQLMDLMNDPDADCRRAALWALRHFGKVGVAVLVGRLDHKDPKARIAALESLSSYPNPKADFVVVEKALDDDDPEVRLVAVEKVRMEFGPNDSRALAALTKVADDEDPRVREAAALRRRQIEERMRLGRVSTVGQAMWKHCQAHGFFPLAATRDEGGKPLLSWRVALLPYLGEQALFDRFDHDQPWDSPHNLNLLERIPEMYCPLGRKKDGKTTLMVFVGDGTPLGGREPVSMADFTDDPSETIMLVEAGPNNAVPWTKPEDITFDSRDPMAALGAMIPEEGLVAVFFSQHTDILPKDVDSETLKALVTYRGGEKIDFRKAAERRARLGPDAKPPEPKPPVPFQFTSAPRSEAHRERNTKIIGSTTEKERD